MLPNGTTESLFLSPPAISTSFVLFSGPAPTELTYPLSTESSVVFDPSGCIAEPGSPPELSVAMGTAGSEVLDPQFNPLLCQ